jgi:RNase P/RNase MRP subunit p30
MEDDTENVLGDLDVDIVDFDFSNKNVLVISDQQMQRAQAKGISLEISFVEKIGCSYVFTGKYTEK